MQMRKMHEWGRVGVAVGNELCPRIYQTTKAQGGEENGVGRGIIKTEVANKTPRKSIQIQILLPGLCHV